MAGRLTLALVTPRQSVPPLQSPAAFLRLFHSNRLKRSVLVIHSFVRANSERVPLDKEKGFVKGEDILSGAEHRLLSTSESVGPRLWDITAESLFWWIAPPNHRYDRNYYHDSSIRTSSRRVCAEVGNTGGVFQGACAVFCIDRSGCESTQSMFRARHRPGAPAGCSRYERSPDS
jgi:hypothetical protein